MGRAWRIEYEGGLYHVLSLENERKDIFYDDQNRLTFLGVMGDVIVTRLAQYPWSSYKAYAYGTKAHKWLLTKPILDRFKSHDKHRAYREKIQRYADEKKKLWENFRHGMIMGTKEFVDKIRLKYMPDNLHREIPQQRALGKSVEPEKMLKKAAGILNCDLERGDRPDNVSKTIPKTTAPVAGPFLCQPYD